MELMPWLELVFLVHWVVVLMSFLELVCSAFKPHLYFEFSGGLLGEVFIVKQLLPLLKHVVHTCIEVSYVKKPEPVQSWSALALIDCLMTLPGLVAYLPREVVVKELIGVRDFTLIFVLLDYLDIVLRVINSASLMIMQDQSCLLVMVLVQKTLEFAVLQVL